MSILDFLISKLAPHDCLACGLEGQLLCEKCLARLVPPLERCYRCQETSLGFVTCRPCQTSSHLYSVKVAAQYAGVAKELIWKLKLDGAQTAADIIAGRLAKLIGMTYRQTLIVPVPTATKRQRQRGYDQAKLLARAVSRQTRLGYADCLARSGQTHQHGLSRRDRLVQLVMAFHVSRPGMIKGADIILVDDVMTTGATLEAAAAVLKAAGAARVGAIVFARPN